MTATSPRRPTAGVIVIGDEVLGGKVIERNIALFVSRFRALGVQLSRVAIITDALDDIAETVATFSARFDIVCTTGGIGPTHDDLTIDGVAQGMGRDVMTHPTLMSLIHAHVGKALNEGYRRMARAPSPCELVGEARWPTVKVDNVFIFPGVPALLARKFEALAGEYFCGPPIWTAEVTVAAQESDVVVALDEFVARHPGVEVGSYPQLQPDGGWNLRLTMESLRRDVVISALSDLDQVFADQVTGRIEARSSADSLNDAASEPRTL